MADETPSELPLFPPDEVDDEDTSSGADWTEPWDPGKIRIATKAFSLRDVVDQINDGEIDLSPDFQREYVWQAKQRTRLIESILLGIPLPAFYFNQAEDGTYQVVDGVQRLSTIAKFMGDEHRLDRADLEYLGDLHNRTCSELDPAAYRRFRSTQIVVHVIEPQTPDEVKYDIFNRVNTLGSPLSPQEIRHAMSKKRSREFIGRLAESQAFDKATENQYWRKDKQGNWIRDSARMTNRELALRFCAFHVSDIEKYRKFPSLDAFLIDFTRRIDGTAADTDVILDPQLAALEQSFDRAMTNAHRILGKAAFRRWPIGGDRRGPINRALFEAQANALARYSLEELLPHREKITNAFRAAFDDDDYLKAVTVGTGDPSRVLLRLQHSANILAEAMR